MQESIAWRLNYGSSRTREKLSCVCRRSHPLDVLFGLAARIVPALSGIWNERSAFRTQIGSPARTRTGTLFFYHHIGTGFPSIFKIAASTA
jgi:hypothetical protein